MGFGDCSSRMYSRYTVSFVWCSYLMDTTGVQVRRMMEQRTTRVQSPKGAMEAKQSNSFGFPLVDSFVRQLQSKVRRA